MNALAQRLREYRGDSSKTLVADAIGISRGFYGDLESGRRVPKQAKHIAGIADTLGIDTDAVYGMIGVCPPDLIDHLATNPKHVKQVRTLIGM